MIKAEVVFDGSQIFVNGYSVVEIYTKHGYVFIINDIEVEGIKTLEQAIAYCLEN